jgi:hypothetical protein
MPAKVSQVGGVTTLSIVKISYAGVIAILDNVMDEVASNEAQSACYGYFFQVSLNISQSYLAILPQG